MSAIGANGDRFTATLSTNVPMPSNNVLVAVWYKKNSTDPGSSDYLAQLSTASEASVTRLGVINSSGYKVFGQFLWRSSGGTTHNPQQSGTLTQDAWRLAAAYHSADFAGSVGDGTYDAGTFGGSSYTSNGSATQGLTALILGDGLGLSSFTFFNGKYAEASIWLVSGATQRDTILAALETKTAALVASENPTATLTGYWPLLNSETAHTGPNLTNVGSAAFDGADHPTLSSAASGAATLLGGKLLRGILVGGGLVQ